jgi:hypothetical protein
MEIKKTLLCVGGLILAAGGPVTVYTGSDMVGGVKRFWNNQTNAAANAPQNISGIGSPTAASGTEASPALAIGAIPTPAMSEVFRFDITVEWIMQRWPRVSTGMPYMQLQGYRVPLVTGTQLTDVAGSLTYYFNAQQRVERITFRGTSGDPSMLVALLGERHHFVRRLTNNPGLIVYESVDSSNHPAGSLKIRSATVVKVDQPYSRFEVELVIDRAE